MKYIGTALGTSGESAVPPMLVSAKSRKVLFENQINPNKAFILNNVGSVPMQLFITNAINQPLPLNAYWLGAGENVMLYAEDISDGNEMKMMVVVNENTTDGKLAASFDEED